MLTRALWPSSCSFLAVQVTTFLRKCAWAATRVCATRCACRATASARDPTPRRSENSARDEPSSSTSRCSARRRSSRRDRAVPPQEERQSKRARAASFFLLRLLSFLPPFLSLHCSAHSLSACVATVYSLLHFTQLPTDNQIDILICDQSRAPPRSPKAKTEPTLSCPCWAQLQPYAHANLSVTLSILFSFCWCACFLLCVAGDVCCFATKVFVWLAERSGNALAASSPDHAPPHCRRRTPPVCCRSCSCSWSSCRVDVCV